MTTLKQFCCAFLFLFATLSAAFARDQPQTLPLFGGPGGGNFSLECPGDFQGVVVRKGAWITSLGIICNGQHLAMTGTGKDPSEEYVCPGGGTVSSIKYGFTRDGNKPKYLDYLEVHCSHGDVQCLGTGDGCWDRHPSPGGYNGYGLTNVSACGAGQHGYGLVGRSGAAIDALAMECFPQKVATTTVRAKCCDEIIVASDGKPHRVHMCGAVCADRR